MRVLSLVRRANTVIDSLAAIFIAALSARCIRNTLHVRHDMQFVGNQRESRAHVVGSLRQALCFTSHHDSKTISFYIDLAEGEA